MADVLEKCSGESGDKGLRVVGLGHERSMKEIHVNLILAVFLVGQIRACANPGDDCSAS